jgi:hypothetical protein
MHALTGPSTFVLNGHQNLYLNLGQMLHGVFQRGAYSECGMVKEYLQHPASPSAERLASQ